MTRQYDHTEDSSVQGSKLNEELDQLNTETETLDNNLSEIRRSDGELQDAVVKLHSLHAEVYDLLGEDGEDGEDGIDGLNSYELAVQEGFTGSLSDWLESLKQGAPLFLLTVCLVGCNGEALPNQEVTIQPDGTSTTTNTDGCAEFMVPAGDYTIGTDYISESVSVGYAVKTHNIVKCFQVDAPTNLREVSSTPNSVALAFDASPNITTNEYYHIMRDGVVWGVVSSHQVTEWVDSLTEPDISYKYKIVIYSLEHGGYLPIESNTINVTTPTAGASASTITLDALKAFPTASGQAGLSATGGRGGSIAWVTNTNMSGAGSFSDALNQSGAKTIMFAVGGISPITGEVYTPNGNVSIAGQTANNLGGIYFDLGKGVSTDRVMHIDGGDIVARYVGTMGHRQMEGSNGGPSFTATGANVIFDHFSDLGSAQGNSPANGSNFTIQHSLFTEGTASQNTGVLIDNVDGNANYSSNATILKSHRLPNISSNNGVSASVLNNYVFGWNGGRHTTSSVETDLDAINNVYQQSPSDSHTTVQLFRRHAENSETPTFYLENNHHLTSNGSVLFPVDNSNSQIHDYPSGVQTTIANRSNPLSTYDLHSLSTSSEIKDYVLNNAGSSVRYTSSGVTTTNADEQRYKNYATTGAVSGTLASRTAYQNIAVQTRALTQHEIDHGFDSVFATTHGLGTSNNVHNETKINWSIDGYTVINNAGYTNLEMYLAHLAGDFHMLANN